MKRDEKILEIIKSKIIEKYENDVSILAVYGTKQAKNDGNDGMRFYFIPKNDRSEKLCTQFIVENVSYDLFPISWERLIANAAMDRPQGYLILDTEIIYSSDQEAVERFERLKESLRVVLSGDYKAVLLNKAYEYFNETYIYIYNMRRYSDCMSSVRLEAGKLLNKIANALGFANQIYYGNGNGSVLRDSLSLKKFPKDYRKLVDEIIFSNSSEETRMKAEKLVENTRELLLSMKKENKQPELFETLFTGYYEELKKSINKCKNAVGNKNYYKLYELFSYMQESVSQFIAKVEEGIWYDDRNVYMEYNSYFNQIINIDLLELVSKKNDDAILKGIEKFEDRLIGMIKKNDIEIVDFDTVEAFESYFIEK